MWYRVKWGKKKNQNTTTDKNAYIRKQHGSEQWDRGVKRQRENRQLVLWGRGRVVREWTGQLHGYARVEAAHAEAEAAASPG